MTNEMNAISMESQDNCDGDGWLHHAEIRGDTSLDLDDLLDQKFVFMTGEVYPENPRRSTRDGDWKRKELSLNHWINGDQKSWGLAVHPEAASKHGPSICPSENIGGARKDTAVKTMYAIVTDHDAGASMEDTIQYFEAAGVFAFVCSTYNHLTTRLELKHDDVMRKLALNVSPDLAQIKEYLRLHHATRYDAAFIDAGEIEDARTQTKDGLRIILKVPAIDKFRVVLPLAEPVELADLAPTLAGWKDIWADKVTGVCRNILKAEFDVSSTDINRCFFTPRSPKGAEFYNCIVMGKPLRFEDIEPFSKTEYVNSRKAQGDPFLAGGDDGNKREMFLTPDKGRSLNEWHRKNKERFLIVDAIEEYCPDRIRVAGGERDGTLHIECPFEHEHSSSGGTATMTMDPHANNKGFWTIFCRHDSCNGRDKLEFLNQMFIDEWLPESILDDERFYLIDDSADVPEVQADEDDPFAPVEEAGKFNERTTAEDIRKFMKRQLRMNVDAAVKAGITSKLVEVTALGKREVSALWKEAAAERAQLEAKNAASDENTGYPVINMWDFKVMCDWSERRCIEARHDDQPVFFQFEGDIALYRNGERAFPTKDQFAATLNYVTKWNHQRSVGENVVTRGVSAPDDVVKHTYNRQPKPYPELLGTKIHLTSPVMDA